MPKKHTKRSGKDESSSSTAVSLVRMPKMIIADHVLVDLPYIDIRRVTAAGAGLIATYQYNLDSIFDPDRTSAGHQPMGRDVYSNFFLKYRVWGVTVHLIATSGSSVGESLVVGLVPKVNDTSVPTTNGECAEEVYSIYGHTQAGGPAVKILKKYRMPVVVGMSDAQYQADDSWESVMSTSPGNTVTLNLFGIHVSGGTALVDVSLKLVYHVELFDRAVLPQS